MNLDLGSDGNRAFQLDPKVDISILHGQLTARHNAVVVMGDGKAVGVLTKMLSSPLEET